MIQASQAWIAAHEQKILPETFVEVSYGAVDEEAQNTAVPSGFEEAVFSTARNVIDGSVKPKYYATLERNLWALNGTRSIFDENNDPQNVGYVSESSAEAGILITFPKVMTNIIPGITITWSSEYHEYAKVFTVTVRRGDTIVATKNVTDNAEVTTNVELDMVDYDRIYIEIYEWSSPEQRFRIDKVELGLGITFTKRELIDFTHEREGDLSSGFISKNSITFSVDNTTGIWNPDNPQGSVKYLTERQKLRVRYGMRVGDEIEWIEGGVFYLSEWDTPSNGEKATFVARDVFEYLLNEPFPEGVNGTLASLVDRAFSISNIPDDIQYHLAGAMSTNSATSGADLTAAEVIQMGANAAGAIIYQDRTGNMHLTPLVKEDSGITILSRISLSHPEVKLTKPLRSVTVSYGEDSTYVLSVANSGENQTITNPFITSEEQARMVAEVTRDALITRKIVSGEFRADPRIDLYDIVTVESKYGNIYPVVLTQITYRYNGAFWATYSGRVFNSEVMED